AFQLMGCGPVSVGTPACGAARRTQVEMVMFLSTVSQRAGGPRHTSVTSKGACGPAKVLSEALSGASSGLEAPRVLLRSGSVALARRGERRDALGGPALSHRCANGLASRVRKCGTRVCQSRAACSAARACGRGHASAI